jgi:hypothetical protein
MDRCIKDGGYTVARPSRARPVAGFLRRKKGLERVRDRALTHPGTSVRYCNDYEIPRGES